MTKCILCGIELIGRSDKKFCYTVCKNLFNNQLRKSTIKETEPTDSNLHRNREILMSLMGTSKKAQFDKLVLTKAKFKFDFHTGHYYNKEGKIYWLIYDFAWMEFSDQRILVVRKDI